MIIYVPVPYDPSTVVHLEGQSVPMIMTDGNHVRIAKLPDVMYQIYYDIARMSRDKEQAKLAIRTDILNWVRDKYPEYAIIGLQDYSVAEAAAVTQRTGLNISWGLYIALAKNAETTFDTIDRLLPEPIKQIEDGNNKT